MIKRGCRSESDAHNLASPPPPIPKVVLTSPDDINGNANYGNMGGNGTMDDWYLELCRRNIEKLEPIERRHSRKRYGSFQGFVKFLTGSENDLRRIDKQNNVRLAVTAVGGSDRDLKSSSDSSRHLVDAATTTAGRKNSTTGTRLAVPSTDFKMKKVYTDPRILTGQKGAASLTQWYDDELHDVAPSPNSRLSGSGSLDMSHGSVNLHDMSESAFNSPPWNGNLAAGVTANNQMCDAAYESSERENLVTKINKMNDQLQSEQKSQQCNVNEYLELSQSIATKDRAQAQRVKAAFERRNQKSTATIQQLQRKLETYKERLKALDAAAVAVPNGTNGGVFGGSPWPAMGMLRGIRTITKPKAFAYMLRKQFGSADNISTIKSMEDEVVPDDSNESPGRIHSTLPASFRCHSDEDLAKLSSSPVSAIAAAMSLASPTAMIVSPPNSQPRTVTETHAGRPTATPQAFTFPGTADERSWQHQHDERRSSSASQSQESTVVMAKCLLQIQQIQEAYKERQKEIVHIRKRIASDQMRCHEMLDAQRERSEHLIERLNDMTDLHQSELTTVKQELSMFEEKLAYQLDERVRDMQEMVDSCHNRLARLEAVQRNSVEGVNSTGGRASVVKLINVALSILALLLVLVGFVVKLLGPFFSSRTRAVCTAIGVALLAVIWFSWSSFSFYPHDAAASTTDQLSAGN